MQVIDLQAARQRREDDKIMRDAAQVCAKRARQMYPDVITAALQLDDAAEALAILRQLADIASTLHMLARDYRAMYRKAFEYHKRHNPPTVDIEYWKSHSPGIDEAPPVELDYWEKAIEDMAATADSIQQDPFLTNLLVAIFEELEKEYKALRDGATAG